MTDSDINSAVEAIDNQAENLPTDYEQSQGE